MSSPCPHSHPPALSRWGLDRAGLCNLNQPPSSREVTKDRIWGPEALCYLHGTPLEAEAWTVAWRGFFLAEGSQEPWEYGL